jgi:hypothetical protein
VADARKKQLALKQRLAANPWCIYCGEPATTIEHMPPLAMFAETLRPNEMVFPCCEPCNRGTKQADQIAAFLSFIDLDVRGPTLRRQFTKLLDGLHNNVPGFVREIASMPRARQKFELHADGRPTNWGLLRTDGPILSGSMVAFAAKLGFAMFYEKTGRRVGPNGGVLARWYTNRNLYNSDILDQMSQVLGEPETLRQGVLHAGDRFAYRCGGDDHLIAVFGLFRRSFAALAVASDELTRLRDYSAGDGPGAHLWLPGSLRKPSPQ